MAKLRVYELAKQVGISSKKLLTILKDLDISVKNHMSTIDKDTAKLVVDLIEEESGKAANKTKEINDINKNTRKRNPYKKLKKKKNNHHSFQSV